MIDKNRLENMREIFNDALESKKQGDILLSSLNISIRKIRKELGMSLREMAGKMGITAAYLSDIELSRRKVSKNVLEKLTKI